jgi:hypothetical protein
MERCVTHSRPSQVGPVTISDHSDARGPVTMSGEVPQAPSAPSSPPTTVKPTSSDAQTRTSIGSLHRELVRDGSLTLGADSASLGTMEGPIPGTENIMSTGSNAQAVQQSSASAVLFPPAAGAAGWIGRVQNRTQELCKWFGLPETEVRSFLEAVCCITRCGGNKPFDATCSQTLLDEFHCALRKRVLLQVG